MTFIAKSRYTRAMNNLILDVDTGEDDALAILLAANLELNLKLVVSSYGNSGVENTTKNTLGIVTLAGLKDCPVFRGAPRPSRKHLHFLNTDKEWESAENFLGGDGLCGIKLPISASVPVIAPPESKRVEELAEIVERLSPVHYVVTGPCTNLAQLCDYFGEKIRNHICKISIMGGALNIAGNSGPRDPKNGDQLAEFNFYCDPYAANDVFRSGVPVYIVGWDTTSHLTIPMSRVMTLNAHDEKTVFIKNLMIRFFEIYGLENNREFEFNDPAALWLSLFASDQFKERRLEAITTSDDFGRLEESSSGHPVFFHSYDKAQVDHVINSLLRLLNVQ